MVKKNKGWLPRIEILLILVFFICFIVWAISKCSARKDDYNQNVMLDANAALDSTGTTAIADDINLPKLPQKEENQDTSTNNVVIASNASRLYVTIDGLRLRKTPELKGEVIMELSLFEEVIFMNEVTDTTQELSLGKEMANEPWVKVKHRKGHEGWVYGAGVNYYKKKRQGVQ